MKLNHLKTIAGTVELSSLTAPQLTELQQALHHMGYPAGPIDGFFGVRTAGAWEDFKDDENQGNVTQIGPASVSILEKRLGEPREHDFSTKEGTINAIIYECRKQGLSLPSQISYVVATAEWETNGTFKPVREAYWLSEDWRRKNLRYYPYYGRGLTQLTWLSNYQKYGNILGIDLVGNPDLAMNDNVSLFVMVHGCRTGAFTGKKLSDYVNSSKRDFVNARRVINGTDKAHHIASLANKWMGKL